MSTATFRSSNPTLSVERFEAAASAAQAQGTAYVDTMSVQGTVTKSLILTGLLLITASVSWSLMLAKSPLVGAAVLGGLIVGLISALVCAFAPKASPIAAPIYALAQGLFLGAISAMFAAKFPGIVVQAVALTMLTLAAMLVLYKMRIIRATEKFKACVMGATLAIGLFYLATFVASFFIKDMSLIRGSGMLSIGISLFVVGIASLNLILDFDNIESGEQAGAPRYMEWYAAFGLMATLIWLYIEILVLLSKLQGRRD